MVVCIDRAIITFACMIALVRIINICYKLKCMEIIFIPSGSMLLIIIIQAMMSRYIMSIIVYLYYYMKNVGVNLFTK